MSTNTIQNYKNIKLKRSIIEKLFKVFGTQKVISNTLNISKELIFPPPPPPPPKKNKTKKKKQHLKKTRLDRSSWQSLTGNTYMKVI